MNLDLIPVLKGRLHGVLVTPEDAGYNDACKIFNGMINKKPAAIAQAADAADIITCVNFAREYNILLAIKGGGHNAAGLALCDDGLVIDLSKMKGIHVDPVAKTALVQAGCLLQDVDHATHAFGLALPMGINGTTGIAGLTLGGGLGNITKQFGLTIDNLLEAHVVLADGSYVKANENENADLFWALRGGSGNFGVVVSFLFKLHPVHTVYAGPMLWQIDDTIEILKWYREFIINAPEHLNGFFATLTVPPAPMFPEELHMKKMCGVVWCYTGALENVEDVFKPIRAVKTPALDFVGPIPMPVLQTMFDALYPAGIQSYWKADFFETIADETLEIHYEFGKNLPTMLSTMHVYPVDGAAAKVDKHATAWNFRDAHWSIVIVGVDPYAANNDKIINWAKDYWNALHPYSMGGAYVNFLMDEGDERVKATYGENYEKLVGIKTKYDPHNLFRVNQNIKPAITALV